MQRPLVLNYPATNQPFSRCLIALGARPATQGGGDLLCGQIHYPTNLLFPSYEDKQVVF